MNLTPALCAALALAACSSAPPAEGRILDYARSNSDGTEWERVAVYLKSSTTAEVYKMRSRCTNAALVTATFDPAADEATQLTGGRLSRQGTQDAFAWLKLEAKNRTLSVHLGAPGTDPVQKVALAGSAPWRLYDFDFADFNALARKPERGETRRWSMALAWPDEGPEHLVRPIGEVSATWLAEERRAGRAAHRYALSGAGFDGGTLWLDARDGTVVEVSAPIPNHPGYTDYQLVLQDRQYGATAWESLLADHWTGCPET